MINKKSIKRTFDYSDYEERGDKGRAKCNNRQGTPKKVQRFLPRQYNKQISTDRETNKRIFGSKKVK